MTGWENASEYAAAHNFTDWEALLASNPKVLWGLIADVVKAVKAGEGERRTGRRPAASVTSLDELYELLFPPAYTGDDFAQAFRVAIGHRSQGSLAVQCGISQPQLSRMASGHIAPTLRQMEAIASALNVRPTYFREYRAQRIGEIVAAVLEMHPQLSAEAVRDLVSAR